MSSRWRWPLVGLLAVVLSIGLRFYDLGGCSLWMDEGFTLGVARLPLQQIGAATAVTERAPPLYYALTHAALAISDTDAALRAPAAAFGVLSVLAVIWLGSIAYGPSEGGLGGLLLAVSALHVMMSRDARSYTVAAFFVTVSTGLWLRELTHPGRRSVLVGWTLTATLALYSHYICFACIGLQVLSGWFLPLRLHNDGATMATPGSAALGWRRAAASTLALCCFAPWLPTMLAHSTRTTAGVVPVAWQVATPQAFSDALYVQGVGFCLNMSSLWQWHALVLIAMLLLIAPVCYRRDTATLLLTGVCGGTIAALIGISMGLRAGIYNAKYLVIITPLFWLLAARGLTQAARDGYPWAARLGAAAVMTLNLVSSTNLVAYDEWHNQDWRGALQVVAERARPGDVMILSPIYALPVVQHYAAHLPPGRLPPLLAVTPETAQAWTPAAVGLAKRVWLVEGQSAMVDPTGRLANLLAAARPRVLQWSAYRRNPSLQVQATLYEAPLPPAALPVVAPLQGPGRARGERTTHD